MVYTVIVSNTYTRFIKTVNEYIADGWIPQGGLIVVNYYDGLPTDYCQSMIRK